MSERANLRDVAAPNSTESVESLVSARRLLNYFQSKERLRIIVRVLKIY